MLQALPFDADQLTPYPRLAALLAAHGYTLTRAETWAAVCRGEGLIAPEAHQVWARDTEDQVALAIYEDGAVLYRHERALFDAHPSESRDDDGRYRVEYRSDSGRWVGAGGEVCGATRRDPARSASLAQARASLAELRKIGGVWADATYRIVDVATGEEVDRSEP